ncbi:MAG TPA: thrombospondin type 3 repeat-containing protein [Polyangiaceae bacterium]|jgi:hypothetical protein
MRARAAFVTAIVLSFASAASAQQPSLDVRTWRPSVDPSASLVLESPNTPGPWAFNFGAYADWQLRPLSLKDPTTGDTLYRPIDYGFGLNLLANVGLGEHASFGIDMPVVLFQTGSDNLPASAATLPVAQTALGDLGLDAKVSILKNKNGGFGLAALAGLTVPTGDHTSFAGEGAVTAQVRVIADYSFVVAHLQASLGYFLRTEQRTWPDASAGGYNFGDEVPWSIGIRLRPDIFHIDREDRQTWELAAHGWVPAGPQAPFVDRGAAALSPVMLALSDRVAIGRDKDFFFTGGIDIGLSDAVGVPGIRVIAGLGWAPREHDKDHDGVPDDVDQCEDIPEDRDGFQDSDGCPDIDNDNDGIVDREDACPNVAGPPSKNPKLNGCPQQDSDGDGIPDADDACPKEKGERTDDPKTNGCPSKPAAPPPPDPNADDDGDGVKNSEDACPKVPGEPSTDPKRNGCPNPDRDGDTYSNDQDECPDAAEVFNGVKDEDGCPDEGGKPLVTIDAKLVIKLAHEIKIGGTADAPAIDPASMTTLRALGLDLNQHRDWVLAVGARPTAATPQAGAEALARAVAVVKAITDLTHRDGSAETVGWDSVKRVPTAASGIGLMILTAPPPTEPKPLEKK